MHHANMSSACVVMIDIDMNMTVQVCQKADFFYNCGIKKEPIWILEQFTPPVFTIQYPWGVDWR